MQTEVIDYASEISSLERLILAIQTNVNFTITIIVGILTLAIGISGWALSILARKWVRESVTKEINKMKKEMKKLEIPWFTPTLLMGWRHDEFEPLSFCKDVLGRVNIRGAIKGGVSGEVAFTLPQQARPSQILTFGVLGGEYPNIRNGIVTIKPSGEAILNIATNDLVYLSGISFIVDSKNTE